MQTVDYMTLSRASGELSDKFYRSVSQWVRNEADKPERSVCIDLGDQYAEALTQQLLYLQNLNPEPKRDEAITRCEAYRATLEKSLGLLKDELRDVH
jgi:hypothetical protein